jgi:hypothetical protein
MNHHAVGQIQAADSHSRCPTLLLGRQDSVIDGATYIGIGPILVLSMDRPIRPA